MLWQIMGTATKTTTGGTITKQIPLFFLDSNVQGITSKEHAEAIASRIVDSFGQFVVSVYAYPVEQGAFHAGNREV